ncbi:L-threonylcarbamoyladenylate synthase [Clostridium cylindrosporum]|uniref:Threonylcarbamoyl-AMP synthase n=1 Tax=Clostridium cylindrosporum DSM 605 TaxID=1121307 RepID=A0A0J8DAB9_CLOCY|nr:L-threonylcarbamoyladenylate synthase [Clostridium cylindrosporum]KMT22797.1 threonylcarbamoyl-AMP synthase Sua [Clostridium cylindrosporum DSM 605]
MDTKVYYIDNDAVINEAAYLIKKGETVVFPTETVYGLGANALDEKACEKIFMAKGRPQDNPLIVHVDNKDISKFVKSIPENVKILIDRFWPGPLTIILEKKDIIPDSITGGLKSVAIRMPESTIARKLIKASGVPIAAPSANLSGKPSPTTIDHCIRDLSGRVSMIIGGVECRCGLESTVVEAGETSVTILRPGEVTKEMIEDLGIKVDIDPTIMESLGDVVPKSPGMKYKHYAPDSDMTIVTGDLNKVIDYINNEAKKIALEGKRVGIIATNETLGEYHNGTVLSIGSRGNLNEVASKLFDVLREFDKIGVDYILSEGFIDEGVGLAIMNRLKKAAGHKVIKL